MKKRSASRKPSIIYVMHGLELAGAEKIVTELAARLLEKDFDVMVVTVLTGGPLERVLSNNVIPYKIIPRCGVFGLGTVGALYKLFREKRPDIVHTHLFLADTWGRLSAWLARVPVIISTEHNINPSYGTAHRVINSIISRMTTVHVAVSQSVRNVLVREDSVPSKKTRVIVNGIDLKAILPRGTRPFRDVPHLISVARLFPQKDHATLLKALALIKRPWRLRIVGIGPLESELRALSERLHIAARIEWLGEREDVPELLADSDVFCFPSKYEGLGLAAIEAVAAGVPLISSNLPCLHELLHKDDVTFVPSGDVPAWTEAIRKTLDDPAAAIIRASRAVPVVTAAASIERMVDQYVKLYREMIKKVGR